MSLDLSSLTEPAPKWQSDWTAAEARILEHAIGLEFLDKDSEEDVKMWAIAWVSCVDQVKAAQALAKASGQTVRMSVKTSIFAECNTFYEEWEKAQSAKKAKLTAEEETRMDEDEEMSDATVATPTRVIKAKGKGKTGGKVAEKPGQYDCPWPEEGEYDPSELVFYNPKCAWCAGVKGDRRCVGVKGAICFGCRHSRKQCSVYMKPTIVVERSASARAGGSASVSRDDDVIEVENPSKKRTGLRAKGIRKSKSASVMDDRAVSPESLRDPDYGEMVMKDLEAQLKTWSMQGWRMAEDLRNLRESLFKDE